jgi:hypothetical protein
LSLRLSVGVIQDRITPAVQRASSRLVDAAAHRNLETSAGAVQFGVPE